MNKRFLARAIVFSLAVAGLSAAAHQNALFLRAQKSIAEMSATLPQGSLEAQHRAAARLVEDMTSAPVPVPADAKGKDITPLFLDMHRRVRSRRLPPMAAASGKVKYLLVYGLFGNHITDYMEGIVRRMKAMGLDAEFVAIQTEGDRESNLLKIQKAVDGYSQVVLIGHSRGGILVHDWYRLTSGASKDKVLKLVLMQAPLRGTPIADWGLEHWYGRLAARALSMLRQWGNVTEAIDELTLKTRERVMNDLPPFTPDDLAKVYTLSSSFEPEVNDGAHKDMLMSHGIIKDLTGEANDGLVPAASAKVPGARNIYVEDFDHEDSALEGPGWFKRLMGSKPNDAMRVGDVSEALTRVLSEP